MSQIDTAYPSDAAPAIRPLIPAVAGFERLVAPIGEPMLRIAAGLMLMPHGAQKLFGWFGGYGLQGTGQFFATKLGLEPGVLMAGMAGSVEFFGGLLLALGLLTRPAAVAVAFMMLIAISTAHWSAGFFNTNGGYEFALLWGLVAVSFALRGGGRFSVDALIGREI
ncbi:DoxX family protein [Insolitispirillum peregrinum]|uniref:Putative oxidoreductase n=1 Tax=Insolitispirillum peregrinum TaxID=80876 RepID=A0A1N7JGP7_9PROT|nr:DoxX family protein [Insolitispirillum peregrinum]SIS48562.1 putative oxidoreductase [Insolitispirillum peregrinum]